MRHTVLQCLLVCHSALCSSIKTLPTVKVSVSFLKHFSSTFVFPILIIVCVCLAICGCYINLDWFHVVNHDLSLEDILVKERGREELVIFIRIVLVTTTII